jgi:hypothetical protein
MEEQYEVKNPNHDFLQINFISKMLIDDKLTDCSLIADGKTLRVHRLILAASSPYFLVRNFNQFSFLIINFQSSRTSLQHHQFTKKKAILQI